MRSAKALLGIVLIALGLASLFPAEALSLISGWYTVGLSGNGLFYIGVFGGLALAAGVVMLALGLKPRRVDVG